MSSDRIDDDTFPDGVSDGAGSPSHVPNPAKLASSCAALSIEDMLRQVPEGETRLFERRSAEDGEERFYAVWQTIIIPDG
ncbi:hypothetical protein [Sphingomonas mollis]|uniref:Uncharacterized protein n=1 Tax=Sphingomonas mollis TaxID=2795726 RepID=A0ABS0XUL2_9SPHN|nr:hypothetical protein [Sphingomonas sp. BT553]MBJ6123724.1 hypothetical protein [Sphingomonas sp. BT553]